MFVCLFFQFLIDKNLIFQSQAWAVYKGKYREGRDKADPTMWKTRLRCALNKSTDFQEVPERNQLDITEPYKVYQMQHDGGPARPAGNSEHNVSFDYGWAAEQWSALYAPQ